MCGMRDIIDGQLKLAQIYAIERGLLTPSLALSSLGRQSNHGSAKQPPMHVIMLSRLSRHRCALYEEVLFEKIHYLTLSQYTEG